MLLQIKFRFYQYVPGLASLVRSYNAGRFELIHQSPCPVVTQLHPALQ